MKTQKIKTMGFFCEDDKDELWRRQDGINKNHNDSLDDLKNMSFQSRIGLDNLLVEYIQDKASATLLYDYILTKAQDFGARLIVLDNIAQIFAGNENIRTHVSQFINRLGELAQHINGAVLLLGHPSKDGGFYSGSTAWDASVRSRWHIGYQDNDDGGKVRILSKGKANYSSTGDSIKLVWDEGILKEVSPKLKTEIDRIADRNNKRGCIVAFLDCLRKCNDSGRQVSHSKNAGRDKYAPSLFKTLTEGKVFSKKEMAEAMDWLFDKEIICHTDTGEKRAGCGSKIKGLVQVKEINRTEIEI